MVKTSLDNATLSADADAQKQYIDRAHSGAERLELILKRLREATRLEQSLQKAEFENFDLGELLRHQTEAFRSIWPQVVIELHCPIAPIPVRAVPDLVSQALEKLMSNAIDFHQPGSGIEIVLQCDREQFELVVINQGPTLPPELDLFKSMVSGRTGRSEEPHLGLGLYLVRLIAEFHCGRAFAENLATGAGVRIGMRIPRECG